MTYRAYFTQLRPVRTLALSLLYGFLTGFSYFQAFWHIPIREIPSYLCWLSGPLALGFFLSGPVHEVLHRPLARLLPDLRSQLRNKHLLSLGLSTLILGAASLALHASVPLPAALGCILAGLTVPLLNTRSLRNYREFWWKALAWSLLAVLSGFPFVHDSFLHFARTWPWGFFILGLLAAVFSFLRAFSKQSLDQRSLGPRSVFCMQSLMMPFGGVFTQMQRISLQQNAYLHQTIQPPERPFTWRQDPGALKLEDWIKITRYCVFNGSSWLRLLLVLSIMVVLISLVPLVVISATLFLASGHSLDAKIIGQTILETTRLGGNPEDQLASILLLLPFLMGGVCLFSMGSRLAFHLPRLPLSRDVLIRCTFQVLLRLLGMTILLLGLLSCCQPLLASLFLHQSLSMESFTRPFELTVLSPALYLLGMTLFFLLARLRWRNLAMVLLPAFVGGTGTMFLIQVGHHHDLGLQFLDSLLTPAGLTLVVAFTVLAAWLCRLTLATFYRRHHFSFQALPANCGFQFF